MNTESEYIPANEILNELICIKRALSDIKKCKASFKRHIKAKKLGLITDEQFNAAKAVLSESIADSLEKAFEAGLGIGQGDIADYRIRAEENAKEILS